MSDKNIKKIASVAIKAAIFWVQEIVRQYMKRNCTPGVEMYCLVNETSEEMIRSYIVEYFFDIANFVIKNYLT